MSRIRKIVQTTNAIEIQLDNGSTTLISGGGPTRMAAIAQTLRVGDEYNSQSPAPPVVNQQPPVLKDQFNNNANELFQRQLSAVFNQSHSPSGPPVLMNQQQALNADPELNERPYCGLTINWEAGGEIEHIGGGAMPSGELPPPRSTHVNDYSGAAGGPMLHEDFDQFSPAVQFALQRAHDRGGGIPFVDDPEISGPQPSLPTMNFDDRFAKVGSQPTANRQQAPQQTQRQSAGVTNANDDLDIAGYALPSLDFSERNRT